MSERRPSQGEEPSATSGEYRSMLLAIDDLENAFAGHHAEHERAVKERARRALLLIARLVEQHCEWVEQPGGLISEVELKLGRSEDVTEVLHVHEQIAHKAAGLLTAIDKPRGAWTRKQVRRQAHDLIKALRDHVVRQGDLLIEQYNRDLGVPD